ncbi:PEP-CTERM sorting domain-containing protein [Phragmitibacter flavus]|uniref:PEP-CTERM sorting domain-containing protein n=1 Tax=Phragmitibacter flavus TaxID=2576071 RepID=A0A5R8KG80_9BACT|nr:PEP-CTERM sorting domain-containing protein [Phragmitibacter flavus]TLD71303.1 PEP-CTERM sorting domain-containing protein [Phragmitibacter flavus]
MTILCKSKLLRIFLGAAVITGAFLEGISYGQTFPTTGSQYIWKVGDGTYSDWTTNFSFNNAAPTSAPNAARDVVFGWEGTPSTAVISLDPLVTATGSTFPSNGNARSFNIYDGDYTFDFNGSTSTIPWSNKIWRFGNGAGNTPTVHFTDSTNADQSIVFTNLVIGDNGSSNNVWGGGDATITFDPNVTHSLTTAGTLTVGSTAGGGGNEFNVQAGQNITRGAITVNAGAGNKISVSGGGMLSTTAATTVGAGAGLVVEGQDSNFTRIGSTEFTISGDVVVSNRATINQSGNGNVLAVNSGGSLTVDNSAFAIERAGINGNNTVPATISGLLDVSNGGQFTGTFTGDTALQSLFRVSSTGHVVVDNGSTFSINNELELQGGAQFEVKGNSAAEVGTYATYYFSSNYVITDTPSVEEGSAFRFDALKLINRNAVAPQFGTTEYVNLLNADGYAKGLLIWGTGGTIVGQFSGHTEAYLALASGTRLQLDGQASTLYSVSRFTVQEGASLEGTGTVDTGSFTNLGLINAGKNDGAAGEAGVLNISGSTIQGQGDVTFDIFGHDAPGVSYDQVRASGVDSAGLGTVSVNVWDRGDGGLDNLFASTFFELFRNTSGGDLNLQSVAGYDFSQSSAVLGDLGLGWDTSEFAATGVLTLQEVARLVFEDAVTGEELAPGSTLDHGQKLKVTNALYGFLSVGEFTEIGDGVDASITSKEVSNAGFEVYGLDAGTEIAKFDGEEYHFTEGTVSFVNVNALNGTHRATLRVGFDHGNPDVTATPVVREWELSQTVASATAATYGETYTAYVDAGGSYAGFWLESQDGTMARLKGGQASSAVILQMSFDDMTGEVTGGANSPQFLSDVVSVTGTGDDWFVLELTYNEEEYLGLYGELGATDMDAPLLAWFDGNDWVNAVLGNTSGTAQYYSGLWQESYGLGSYGWDEETGMVWAVLDHNSDFGVLGGSVVPEPSRMVLVLLGAMALIFHRKRR